MTDKQAPEAGEDRRDAAPAAADFRFLLRLRAALQDYQAETAQPAPGPTRGAGNKG